MARNNGNRSHKSRRPDATRRRDKERTQHRTAARGAVTDYDDSGRRDVLDEDKFVRNDRADNVDVATERKAKPRAIAIRPNQAKPTTMVGNVVSVRNMDLLKPRTESWSTYRKRISGYKASSRLRPAMLGPDVDKRHKAAISQEAALEEFLDSAKMSGWAINSIAVTKASQRARRQQTATSIKAAFRTPGLLIVATGLAASGHITVFFGVTSKELLLPRRAEAATRLFHDNVGFPVNSRVTPTGFAENCARAGFPDLERPDFATFYDEECENSEDEEDGSHTPALARFLNSDFLATELIPGLRVPAFLLDFVGPKVTYATLVRLLMQARMLSHVKEGERVEFLLKFITLHIPASSHGNELVAMLLALDAVKSLLHAIASIPLRTDNLPEVQPLAFADLVSELRESASTMSPSSAAHAILALVTGGAALMLTSAGGRHTARTVGVFLKAFRFPEFADFDAVLDYFASHIVSIVDRVVESITKKDISTLFTSRREETNHLYAKVKSGHVFHVASNYPNLHYIGGTAYILDLREAVRRYTLLADKPRAENSDVHRAMELNVLLADAESRIAPDWREAPFTVAFTGASCIGKSSLVAVAAKVVLEASGLEYEPGCTHAYNFTAKHDDGISAAQHIMWMDDVGNIKQADGNPGFSYGAPLLEHQNNAVHACTMASLEQKGRVFSRFKGIILTSNMNDCGIIEASREPASMARRVHYYIRSKVRPGREGYAKPDGTLDSQMASNEELPDAWLCTVETVRLVPQSVQGFQYVVVDGMRNVSIFQVREFLAAKARSHVALQRKIMTSQLGGPLRASGVVDWDRFRMRGISRRVDAKAKISPADHQFARDYAANHRAAPARVVPASFGPAFQADLLVASAADAAVLPPAKVACNLVARLTYEATWCMQPLVVRRGALRLARRYMRSVGAPSIPELWGSWFALFSLMLFLLFASCFTGWIVAAVFWASAWCLLVASYPMFEVARTVAARPTVIDFLETQLHEYAEVCAKVAAFAAGSIFLWRMSRPTPVSPMGAVEMDARERALPPDPTPPGVVHEKSCTATMAQMMPKLGAASRPANFTFADSTVRSCVLYPMRTGQYFLNRHYATKFMELAGGRPIDVLLGQADVPGRDTPPPGKFTITCADILIPAGNRDVAFVFLKGRAEFNCTPYLIPAECLHANYVMHSRDGEIKHLTTTGAATGVLEPTSTLGSIVVQLAPMLDDIYLFIKIRPLTPTRAGHCGSACIIDLQPRAGSHAPVIAGFVAGEVEGFTMLAPVTRSVADAAFAAYSFRVVPRNFTPYGMQPGDRISPERRHPYLIVEDVPDRLQVMGILTNAQGVNLTSVNSFKSDIVPTPLSEHDGRRALVEELISPSMHVPPRDPKSYRHYQKFFDKLVGTPPNVNADLLRLAADDHLATCRAALGARPVAALTLFESVNGDGGEIKPLDLSTASGPGLRGKKINHFDLACLEKDCPCALYHPVPSEVHNAERLQYYPKRYVLDMISAMRTDLLAGKKDLAVFRGAEKNEVMGVNKFDMRIYLVGSTPMSIIMRQYFTPITSRMTQNMHAYECTVGIDTVAPQFDEVARTLFEHSTTHVLGGDYSGWDNSLSGAVCDATYDVFTALGCDSYGEGSEAVRIMKAIGYNMARPVYNILGLLVRMYGSGPSGVVVTTHMNSMANGIVVKYSWMRQIRAAHRKLSQTRTPSPELAHVCNELNRRLIDPSREAQESLFHESNALYTYGDDLMGATREPERLALERAGHPFDNFALREGALELGMKFGSLDKLTALPRYYNASTISFLKRDIVMSDRFGRYVGQLEPASITKSLFYQHGKAASLDVTKCTMSSALRLYFWHCCDRADGPERYDRLADMCAEQLYEIAEGASEERLRRELPRFDDLVRDGTHERFDDVSE